jgi:hypothetical protein
MPNARTGHTVGVLVGDLPAQQVTVDASDSRNLPGFRVGNFGDDVHFERVHVEPVSNDAGFVVSPQQLTLRAWNASRYRAVFAVAYEVTGDSGVELQSPPSVPQHFPPLFQQDYTVFVDDSGPANFENTVIIRFEDVFGAAIPDAETDALYFGVRVVPFPLDPAGDVLERYGYLTRILQSGNGNEQRAGLRRIPVRGWTLEFVMPRAESRLAHSLIHGWQHRAFGLPIWYDETVLESGAAAGATTLFAETIDRVWGNLAILWQDPETWEVLQVSGADSGIVTLDAVLLSAWPAGSKLYPVHLARMRDRQPVNWRGLDVALMRAEFDGEDWSET